MDPTIRLMVELKGPKQGLFSLDCELDVTIGEMKDQILEILEKNIGKNFISQGKFYMIMILRIQNMAQRIVSTINHINNIH